MSRLLIAAQKGQMETIIEALYRKHLAHIEEFTEGEEEEALSIGKPLAGAGKASSSLVTIRGIENACGLDPDSVKAAPQGAGSLRQRIDSDLPSIQDEVQALVSRRQQLESAVRDVDQRIRDLTPFAGVSLDLEMLHGYESVSVHAGWVSAEPELSCPHEMVVSGKDRQIFLVLFAPAQEEEEVERALAEAAFQSVPIPDERGSAGERIAEYTAEKERLQAEIESVQQSLEKIRNQHAGFLAAAEELLTAEVQKAEAPLRFATSDEAFLVECYVPGDQVTEITGTLEEATAGRVFVTEIPIDDPRRVPVEYDHPIPVRPTEVLMDLYSRPRYTEVDPTLFMSIIFPIFFGLILGDVGYGVILLALALGLRKVITADEGRKLLAILRDASISSIIFGLLFSEIFGFALPWDPIIFNRHLNIGGHAAAGHGPAVAELMVVSVWIGVLHLTLGRTLGAINHWRQDHGMHRIRSVLAQVGWIITMWGILLIIWSAYTIPLMPDFTTLSPVAVGLNVTTHLGGVMLIAGVVLVAQESVIEIIEFPSLISHVLSYARLVAVGLSSVAIAMVVNYLAIGLIIEPQLEQITPVGVILIIVGIVVLVVGHLGNTALGLIGGGLQTIRLHYVEFFTKFYKGGGRKFDPFGMKRKFTED
ncbi:MAG: V-type ATP synthase subunit I [Methanomicrobiales archaeon]